MTYIVYVYIYIYIYNKSLFQDAKTWKLVELKFRASALINYKQLQNKFKIKHKTKHTNES